MDDDFAEPRSLPPGQRRHDRLRPIHYGRVPRVDLDTWCLTIGGETVDGGVTRLSWADFSSLPRIEVTSDHHCVSHRSVQDVRWSGVAARTVVDLAPPTPSARYVMASAVYGYHTNVTVDDLMSPRALIATHLDGQPLSDEHGWPARLVLPHLYGWKGPKWLLALEYSTQARRGFWEQQGYHFVGDAWREERYAHQE